MITMKGTLQDLSAIDDFVKFKGTPEEFEKHKNIQLTVTLYKAGKGITDFDREIEEKVKGKLDYSLHEESHYKLNRN